MTLLAPAMHAQPTNPSRSAEIQITRGPDGKRIAFVRRIPSPDAPANQIFVIQLP